MIPHALLPCPFCGKDAMLITCLGNYLHEGPPWYEKKVRAVCSSPNCCGVGMHAFTDADAINVWNTRANAPNTRVVTVAQLDRWRVYSIDDDTHNEIRAIIGEVK